LECFAPVTIREGLIVISITSSNAPESHSGGVRTPILLKRFEGNPGVEKAKVDFDHAQEVEERFHKSDSSSGNKITDI
jgi:hypothetical protein